MSASHLTKKSPYTHLGTFFWILAAIFAVIPSWPYIYYRLSPNVSQTLASNIAITAETANNTTQPSTSPNVIPGTDPESRKEPRVPGQVQNNNQSLPLLDLSLPTKNGLIIEAIGVKGELQEGEEWENLLKKGIWRVPSFATPETQTLSSPKPIILAAHRWGYLEWSSSFRKLNSFYSLPKLKEGDKIELIWNQRKYEYAVSSTSTGTEITNYSHNLILYTCQLWNSPVRFFVYATRTN